MMHYALRYSCLSYVLLRTSFLEKVGCVHDVAARLLSAKMLEWWMRWNCFLSAEY